MSCSHISTQCYCRARLQVQTRLCKSYPSTISDSLDIFIEGFCYTILMLTLTTNRTKKTFSAYVINVFLHNWRSSGPASVFFSWPKLLQGYNQHSPKSPSWVLFWRENYFLLSEQWYFGFPGQKPHFAFWLYPYSIDYNLFFQSQYLIAKFHCDTFLVIPTQRTNSNASQIS